MEVGFTKNAGSRLLTEQRATRWDSRAACDYGNRLDEAKPDVCPRMQSHLCFPFISLKATCWFPARLWERDSRCSHVRAAASHLLTLGFFPETRRRSRALTRMRREVSRLERAAALGATTQALAGWANQAGLKQ